MLREGDMFGGTCDIDTTPTAVGTGDDNCPACTEKSEAFRISLTASGTVGTSAYEGGALTSSMGEQSG